MFDFESPRKLTKDELELLFHILPERKSGYRIYRDMLAEYYLTGKGAEEGTYLLTKEFAGEMADFHTPVFAAGTYAKNDKMIDVVIHEESESCIEIEIEIGSSQSGNNSMYSNVIYPEWDPGMTAPGDNSEVREVVLIKGRYLIAIVRTHERLWLYDYETGVNHFMSVGAFYNNLCFVRNIREPGIVFNNKLLFQNLDSYSDNELISAFHLYDKSLRKFNIE